MLPHALSGLGFVERFYTFPSRTSTNAFARSLQKTPGLNKITVVQADNHPYGFSEETAVVLGSLTASILTSAADKSLFSHTRALCLAIIDSIEAIVPPPVSLQILWPDRIYWNAKEICVLRPEESQINSAFAVLGFSLLVNTLDDLLPRDTEQQTTSLQIQTSRQHPVSRLLYNIINSYHDLIDQPEDSLHQRYLSLLYGTSEEIEINGFRGILNTVEKDGKLRVHNHSCTEYFVHGQIRFEP